MLTTKQFLKQGLQVGPWKITRKVLLFIVAFCFVVLAFGTLMLETHAFDSDWDDDDDNSHERYDDDDDDWELGGGDMVMMVLMGITGLVIMACALACCFAQVNPPSHLDQRGNEQVFTIQLTKPSIGPQHPESLTHYQLYHQQQYEQQLRQYQQQQQQQSQSPQQQQQQHNSSRPQRATAPSAHAHHARSPPPPYSLPAAGTSPSVPPNASHTNEKPPPYSP